MRAIGVALFLLVATLLSCVGAQCPCQTAGSLQRLGMPYAGLPDPDIEGFDVMVLQRTGFRAGYSFKKEGPLWVS